MKKLLLTLLLGFSLFTLCEGQYTNLHDFTADSSGLGPIGTVTISGNMLYGMTRIGGLPNNDGLIFSIHTDGSGYRVLFEFNGLNGAQPYGSLILSGDVLYGITPAGGLDDSGCVFSIDTNGSGYKDLLDFNGSNGSTPYGDLTLSGKTLFGMTCKGGALGYGCIFSLDTNGNGFTDKHNFNGISGGYPYGNSLKLSGSKLYGMTQRGGLYDSGCVFSIDTSGSNFKDILDFNCVNGAYPVGSLVFSGGRLYGMAFNGATTNYGCIFSIDTNGAMYKNLFNFDGVNNGYPTGALSLSGSTMYGASLISMFGGGLIFSIDTDGTNYKDIHNFTGTLGTEPNGSVVLSGNMLYGMTKESVWGNGGNVFSIDTAFNTTGINTISNKSAAINVYPNPSSGVFNMVIRNKEQGISEMQIEVYNVLGEQVYSQSLSLNPPGRTLNEINLSGQPQGVYFYRVIGDSGNLIGEGKLVIER